VSLQQNSPDSIYTQQVKKLIDLVYPQESGYGSVFEDARHYFGITPELEKHAKAIQSDIDKIKDAPEKADVVAQLQKKLKGVKKKLDKERLERLARVNDICNKLVALSEGDTWLETQQQSAKFLGTLMLLTRGPEGKFELHHQRLKPLYKAVLALRLIDKLLNHETIAHPYLSKYREVKSRFSGNRYWQEKWRLELAIPVIKAALLQDVGLQSPDAITILRGENNELSEFRLLEETQRKELLKLNYYHTMKYLSDGLGTQAYIGNSKEERARFVAAQDDAQAFLINTVKDAFVSKTGLGEIIKIPQIYVSIILSTKSDYTRKELPKGYLLIEQLSKKGVLNKQLAEDFINIVGYFPQGFGVTFIPLNENGQEKDQFECGIVVGLNPENPAEPIIKVVTRNQQYINHGQHEVVAKNQNLYFPANRKKLMRVGKDRLREIMSQLSSNYTPDAVDDLIPSFWEPHDFFAFKKHQNLWAKNN